MTYNVESSYDPARALGEARDFLAADPVRNNLILTLLNERVSRPEPGRYWLAKRDGIVGGVVFHSPLAAPVTLTPMQPGFVSVLVDAISELDGSIPGVNGEAATAATFAGQWTERTGSAAVPIQGQRLYEVGDVSRDSAASGRLLQAGLGDREILVAWLRGFMADVGEQHGDPERIVDSRLPVGQFWIWDDGRPVSMAANSAPTEGVARIQAVYTPPDRRNYGYATACVSHLSAQILERGNRCILYTDLANPVSNSIYRRMGYRAVSELLRYGFETRE